MSEETSTSSAWRQRLDFYQQRLDGFEASTRALQSRSDWLARLRVGLFLVFLLALAVAIQQSDLWGMHGIIASVVLLFFVISVMAHDRVMARLEDVAALRRISAEQTARLRREWDDVLVPRVELPDESLAVANDLDLFGKASLFHLVCNAHTSLGRRKLRDWLLHPAAPPVIVERQQAARQMAGDFETLECLSLEGMRLSGSHAGPHEMCEWADEPLQLARWKGLTTVARALPLTALASILLAMAGVLSGEASFFICCFVILANLLVSVMFTGSIHTIFNRVSSPNGEVQRYVTMFDVLERSSHEPSAVQRLQSAITADGKHAQHEIHALGRIMSLANLRHDPMFALFYVVLQLIVLWDIHVFWLLERWKARNHDLVAKWFDAIAEFEALSSLAILHADHPDWCFPKVDGDQQRFVAAQLGHPLLPEESRICNDVALGPAGSFLLVTGSNMSGKSTLLRSIGTNLALAQAGGPVCSRQMETPPVVVATSMRVQDSLDDGISFYMAELRRLKEIVDQAALLRADQRFSLFFLLDEILQGTNSAERHIAVSRVIKHLLANDAMGAVSTHDLELANSDYLSTHCRCVHFRETLVKDERRMTFDYRMREGVAPTTNALVLLEMVGLGER